MIALAALLILNTVTAHPDLTAVRTQYEKAIENKAVAESLYENLNSQKDLPPTLKGYLGVSRMLLAKFAFNPYSKWNHFTAGRDILEQAIKSDPKNAELRLLRISTQLNVPEILDYSDDIDTDKNFLLSSYSSISDPDLRNQIRYLLISYKLAPESAFNNRNLNLKE